VGWREVAAQRVIPAQAGIQSVYRARSARRLSPSFPRSTSFPRRRESSRFTEHGVHGDCPRHFRARGNPVGLPSTECTATVPVIPAQAGIQSVYRARSARRLSPSFPRRREPSRFTEHGVHGDCPRHSRAGGNPVGLPSTECTATVPVIPAHAGIQSVYRARSARRLPPSFPRTRESSRFTEHGVHGDCPRHFRAGGNPVGLPSTECTATVPVIPAQAGMTGERSRECLERGRVSAKSSAYADGSEVLTLRLRSRIKHDSSMTRGQRLIRM